MRLLAIVLASIAVVVLLVLAAPAILDSFGYRLQPTDLVTDTRLDFATTVAEPLPAVPAPAVPAPAETDGAPPTARNVILLVGDGMGFSQLAAGRYATVGPNGRLVLDRFPVTGWSFTHSAENLYTDSAAGATAFATGHKTLPGRLSVDVEGAILETIAEKAMAAGKAVGLVTDSTLLDATPAAFVAHRESRRDYFGVAADMAESGALVLLGETRDGLETDELWPPIRQRFADNGHVLVHDAEGLAAAPLDAPVVGLFAEGSISEPDRAPSLVDLAGAALDRLRADPDGFFLMVETEETDTYSHRNQFERAVAGVAALDRVAELMVDFAAAEGDTLVVVTADHDTGGLTVLGGEPGEPIHVRWSTGGHTAEPVPVLAYGVGAERFGGALDNTELGRRLQEALDTPSAATP